MKFIKVKVKDYIVMHGYDKKNKEIEESISVESYNEKIIAIDRILSVSEKYILTSYAAGRIIYWNYQGDLVELEEQLAAAGMIIP